MLNCAYLENRRTGAAATPANLTRYAIYYTPQPRTALAAFGRSWFGRANDGVTLQAFSAAGLAGTSFAKIAAGPGRYTGLQRDVQSAIHVARRRGPRCGESAAHQFCGEAQVGRDRTAHAIPRRPFARAASSRCEACTRVARCSVRGRVRGFRRVADRRRACGICRPSSQRLSARPSGELWRSICAERVSLCHQANRIARHGASWARGAGRSGPCSKRFVPRALLWMACRCSAILALDARRCG